MELNVNGAKPVTVSEAVFGKEFRQDLVHQVVVAYRNAGRAGTKRQKSRSEVNGTTKKSKKQKGGGARHGALTAPIFVGGGVTFAARPRSFEQKVNRKMFRGAMVSILSELNRQGRISLVESFGVEQPKTKTLVAKLGELKAEGRVVLVAENAPEALFLAARNIPYVHVVDAAALDPVSLVGADRVVLTVESLKRIEEWLV
jgi:large subunit ribosomal protein L4